jgi:hypothetical protein
MRVIRGTAETKKFKIETGLDKLIQEYGTISLARFKKEAAKAWHRAFPDGIEKREVKGYQLFVKETMQRVKAATPNMTHHERMAIIGRMWQETKGTPPAPAPALETDDDPVPKKRALRSGRLH